MCEREKKKERKRKKKKKQANKQTNKEGRRKKLIVTWNPCYKYFCKTQTTFNDLKD